MNIQNVHTWAVSCDSMMWGDRQLAQGPLKNSLTYRTLTGIESPSSRSAGYLPLLNVLRD